MRTLLALILSCATLVDAQDTTNISSKVFEKHDKDGKINLRVETVYRGKAKVMMVSSRPNKDGVMVVTSRSYLASGDLVMTESDKDHDGTFETIVIHHPGTGDMEVFTRKSDGSVKPVDTKTLEAYKKQIAAVNEFTDKSLQKEMSDQELRDSIQKTQKKIQDAEKEKKDKK